MWCVWRWLQARTLSQAEQFGNKILAVLFLLTVVVLPACTIGGLTLLFVFPLRERCARPCLFVVHTLCTCAYGAFGGRGC